MNEPSHLPDDVDRWPRNPFDLLGVGYGSSRREIRAAYESRWRCAHQLKQWEVVVADLEALRPSVESDKPHPWTRLRLAALDYMAWGKSWPVSNAFDSHVKEVEGDCADDVKFAEVLARLDHLSLLRHKCNAPHVRRLVPEAVLKLTRDSWVKPFDAIRTELLAYLEPVAVSPIDGLRRMGQMQQATPSIFGRLAELIARLDADVPSDDGDNPNDALAQVMDFWRCGSWTDQSQLRHEVLTFCLDEYLSIDTFVRLSGQSSAVGDESLALLWSLGEDRPLQCVWKTCRVFARAGSAS